MCTIFCSRHYASGSMFVKSAKKKHGKTYKNENFRKSKTDISILARSRVCCRFFFLFKTPCTQNTRNGQNRKLEKNHCQISYIFKRKKPSVLCRLLVVFVRVYTRPAFPLKIISRANESPSCVYVFILFLCPVCA